MAKYKLTARNDKLKGTDRNDLFEGVLSGVNPDERLRLTTDDRIDGRKGNDLIRATIGSEPTAPTLKNIERGEFYVMGESASLDLIRATKLASISFLGTIDDGVKDIQVSNARAVSSLRILGSDDDRYVLNDLNTDRYETFKLYASSSLLAKVELQAADGQSFHGLEVSLDGNTDLELTGSAVDVEKLTVISSGSAATSLKLEANGEATIRELFVKGTQSVTLISDTGAFRALEKFDSTGSAMATTTEIGGDSLVAVSGGAGAETLDIVSIGGSPLGKANVLLADGSDSIVLYYAFDAGSQYYDGGIGLDAIEFTGEAADLASAVKNFETLKVNDASGVYDVTGIGLTSVILNSSAGAVTIDGLASTATLGVMGYFADGLTVKIAGAQGATTDVMNLVLHENSLGSSEAGLSAEHLSRLTIDNLAEGGFVYLSALGSAVDAASVEISGEQRFELKASIGATSYISSLLISNDAGVDLSGLVDASQTFVATGATITGGAGDDVLIGGAGDDTIATGRGNNTVYGSLGADHVTLIAGAASDTLIFTAQDQSSFGAGHDTAQFFASTDRIDISSFAHVGFVGNFDDNALGLAALSTTEASAFYNTETKTLYIDLDYDQLLTAEADIEIVLNILTAFSSDNLIT
ncbi:MAG: hypothetical protein JWL86_6174 [Rhizobium sp.]|nr:hypothetical protein [Rhizobium sp.]